MIVPPYGTAIHEAIASGDLQRMKTVSRQAQEYLAEHGNVPESLEVLKVEIARLEGRNKG